VQDLEDPLHFRIIVAFEVRHRLADNLYNIHVAAQEPCVSLHAKLW
jgi:hypothetical protein